MAKSKTKRLKKIIKRMKKVQRDIAGDDQPVSPLQLEELKILGKQYGELVTQLSESDNK